MKTQKQLQDDYDEALFSLYMGQVMLEQGNAFIQESELLKHRDDFSVPRSLDYRVEQSLHTMAEKERIHKPSKRRKLGRNVLVAVCTLVILFGVSYLTIPEVQAWTMRFVMQSTDKVTNFILDSGANHYIATQEISTCKISYIPEGFACYEEIHDNDMHINIWKYRKGESYITIRITDAQPVRMVKRSFRSM